MGFVCFMAAQQALELLLSMFSLFLFLLTIYSDWLQVPWVMEPTDREPLIRGWIAHHSS
jgi:hypothetical protein